MKLLLCLLISFSLLLTACQSEDKDQVEYSGKKKIAYTPYQKATLTHVAPVVTFKQEAEVAAVQGVVSDTVHSTVKPAVNGTKALTSLSQLNVETLVTQAKNNTKSEKEASIEHSKLAAGWPGQNTNGKQAQKPAQKTAKPMKPTAKPNPHAATSQPTSQPVALGGVIHGEISIKPELVSQLKANAVMFVIVRRYAPAGQKGMMIAAIKVDQVTASKFPLRYAVTPKDAMMGAPLAGKVTVSARIDQDGDAISKQPGDLVGQASKAVMVGINPVKFTIDKSL